MDNVLGYVPEEKDYYEILGCDELSSTEQINAEYKIKAKQCHPDKHPNCKEAAQRFANLQKAKEELSCPEKRHQYDSWRRSGLAISYEAWCSKKIGISLHWATKPKKMAMLQDQSGTGSQQHNTHGDHGESFDCGKVTWMREENNLLKRFRQYDV